MGTDFEGVSYETVRIALRHIIYGVGETEEEEKALEEKWNPFIVPMIHNYFNPLQGDIQSSTFVEYWIEEDRRLTQDEQAYNAVATRVKVATILLRFIGKDGENAAKLMHMLASRNDACNILFTECNATLLEYVSPIFCKHIDYYGKNGAIAWEMRLMLQYQEIFHLDQQPLKAVHLVPGNIDF